MINIIFFIIFILAAGRNGVSVITKNFWLYTTVEAIVKVIKKRSMFRSHSTVMSPLSQGKVPFTYLSVWLKSRGLICISFDPLRSFPVVVNKQSSVKNSWSWKRTHIIIFVPCTNFPEVSCGTGKRSPFIKNIILFSGGYPAATPHISIIFIEISSAWGY